MTKPRRTGAAAKSVALFQPDIVEDVFRKQAGMVEDV